MDWVYYDIKEFQLSISLEKLVRNLFEDGNFKLLKID